MAEHIRRWIVKRDGKEFVVDDEVVTREEFREIALDLLDRKPVAPAEPPEQLGKAERPFQTGDVVRLKSGGFLMTVVNGQIGCGGVIDVAFASEECGGCVLQEEKLPPECLVLVNYDQAQRMIRAATAISSNVPF